MELPWNDPRSNKFATTIGLITSNGPSGTNIMACEWTHHLSYNPGLIAVSLGPTKTTVGNIRHNKEFGINLCGLDQSILSSIPKITHLYYNANFNNLSLKVVKP